MVSRSSVPHIHTPPPTSTDAAVNAMYAVPPDISSVHLVGYEDASFSSCCITFTNFITDVDFYRFTHDNSCPSTSFTGVNISFAPGNPIVAWRHFTMTERNVLKYIIPPAAQFF